MPGTHICTQPVSGCLFLAFCGSLLCSPHLFETPCPTDHVGARSKCSVSAIRCFWPLPILSTPPNGETLLFWFVALCYPNSPPASLPFLISFPWFFGLFLCCPKKIVSEFLCSVHLRIQTKGSVPNLGLGFKVSVQISGKEHKNWSGDSVFE